MSLKTELADARYAGMTDEEAAADLNTPRIPRNRTSMSRSEIMQAVTPAAYNNLTGDDLVAFWGLLSVDSLDPFGVEADVMIKLFSSGSATITALQEARVYLISRDEEAGISREMGHSIEVSDVAEARA